LCAEKPTITVYQNIIGLSDAHLPNLVDRAVPFFVVSVATEFTISKWREARKAKKGQPGNAGNNESPYTYFRANDSLNSLRYYIITPFCHINPLRFLCYNSMGMLQQMMHLSSWVKSVMIIPYLYIWEHYAIIRLDADSWVAWFICLLIVEFGYYWYHRMSHEMNIFWAAHIAHHSSQGTEHQVHCLIHGLRRPQIIIIVIIIIEFNLTTALRQGAIQYSFSWIFFWPVALVCPPSLVNFHLHFNRIYQFWIHTELIRRLPAPLEWLLNTPSHHRAHHGILLFYSSLLYLL
jgi:sterol desaturase/sphingolipid hydroxylase (fatty acid hydroxylase superfamily)